MNSTLLSADPNFAEQRTFRERSAFSLLRAQHLGMCFGVRDAIALAHHEAARQPLTILGDLVHNDAVLADLRARGVQNETALDQVRTETVLITAHGTSEQNLRRVRARGHQVLEATCPLVRVAHHAVQQLVAQGYYPVIVGKRDHVEVRGLTDDLAEHSVILQDEDVAALPDKARFGVAAQTTQPVARVRALASLIRQRFPKAEVRLMDTVCQPTKQRQAAAEALARSCDVVVVVGGAHSNNTRELVETCRRLCARVHHVSDASGLCSEWFHDAARVGLTAGTSTPDAVIDSVARQLEQIARALADSRSLLAGTPQQTTLSHEFSGCSL